VGCWGSQACAGSWSFDHYLAAELGAAQAMEASLSMQRRPSFDSSDPLRSYDEAQLMTIQYKNTDGKKLHNNKYSQVARHRNKYKA
jgi:hypothetical protein